MNLTDAIRSGVRNGKGYVSKKELVQHLRDLADVIEESDEVFDD